MKKKVLILMYLILLGLCILTKSNEFKNIMLIVASFLFIFILSEYFKIKNQRFKIICIIIVAINILIMYLGYYQSIKMGYLNGLIRGNLGLFTYFDTSNYYIESSRLVDLWNNGGFKYWIHGNLDKGNMFYGYYNFFVIWNCILKIIFKCGLNTLILIKLQFSIINIFLLYQISKIYLNEKYSMISVLLFNIFPGYLLVNISLMRDNIVVMFILYSFYIFLKNNNKLNKLVLFKLLISISLVTYIRVYIGLSLIIFFIIYYYWGKLNLRRIVIGCLMLIIIIFLIGKIIEKMGYGFLGIDLIRNSEKYLNRFDETKVQSPINLFFWTIYNMLFAGKVSFDYSGYIGNIFNSINNLIVAIISTISIMFSAILYKYKSCFEFKKFIFSGIIFSFVSCMMITFIFSSIIPRLYICWIWIQIIIICRAFQLKSNGKDIIKLVKFLIPTYITILAVYLIS